MPKSLIVALSFLASTYVHTAQATDGSLIGEYTFNWFTDPSRTRCMRVDKKLLSMLTSSQFECKDENTGSGVRITACSKVDGHSGYLIFKTFASCENERKTQAVNE
jgi:hypothetical protein